jgi:hypothetical protein
MSIAEQDRGATGDLPATSDDLKWLTVRVETRLRSRSGAVVGGATSSQELRVPVPSDATGAVTLNFRMRAGRRVWPLSPEICA